MDVNYWHSKIKETIEKMSYEVFVIHRINDVICPCVNSATKQAEPGCKMCLGTGNKVKIRKIKVAANDIEGNASGSRSVRGSAATTVTKKYFVDVKYPVGDYDIIVDDDELMYVFRVYTMKGFNGEVTHNQIEAFPKRNDHDIILKNFNEIMKKYYAKFGGVK